MKDAFRLYFLLGIIIPMLMLSIAPAAAVNGTSNVTLNTSAIGIYQGGSGLLRFVVSLNNGTAGNTTFVLVNKNQMASFGITANFSNASSVDLPFRGTFTINVASSTQVREYNLTFNAAGADPSVNNATLELYVLTKASSTTTIPIPTTTIQLKQGGLIPTPPPRPETGTSTYVVIVAAIIVVIGITVLHFIRRKK